MSPIAARIAALLAGALLSVLATHFAITPELTDAVQVLTEATVNVLLILGTYLLHPLFERIGRRA